MSCCKRCTLLSCHHNSTVTGLPKLCPQKYAFHCPRHHPQFDTHRVQLAAASSCDLSGETPEVQLFESLPQLPPDNVKEALTWLVLQLDAMCCHKVRHGSSHLKQLVYRERFAGLSEHQVVDRPMTTSTGLPPALSLRCPACCCWPGCASVAACGGGGRKPTAASGQGIC